MAYGLKACSCHPLSHLDLRDVTSVDNQKCFYDLVKETTIGLFITDDRNRVVLSLGDGKGCFNFKKVFSYTGLLPSLEQTYRLIKGVLHTKPKLSMFCALSENQ